MGVDFNRLDGGQRAILRRALIGAFDSREFERFLVDHNFDRLENLATDGDFEARVFDVIESLFRAGDLGRLMELVLEKKSKSPAFQDLESRLLAAESRDTSTPTDSPPRKVWMVPHRRNPYFTAREDALSALHEALHGDGCAVVGQMQAISGLGGIGKTQTAVEYAYRHRDEYEKVLWVRGATAGDLAAGFGEVAQELGLAGEDADQRLAAVHGWMHENTSWLLVIDNADTPDLLNPYLPSSFQGHILLTSRASYFGPSIGRPLRLDSLSPDDARSFLLERTELDEPDAADEKAAADLAEELGFLPLALEQAGAYIAAKKTRLESYLADYRKFRMRLLECSSPETGNYSDGVEATWNLSFQEVERRSQASGDVLRLSAFLSPERIPEELLTEGASKLGPAISEALDGSGPLQLDELLEPLRLFSLIERHTQDRSFSVHPLVQDVVRANLDEDSRESWEERVVRSLDQTSPKVEFKTWSLCARLLPHVEAFKLVAGRLHYPVEAARLFSWAANYLVVQGRYKEAESLYRRNLAIIEKSLGSNHLEFASALNNLALVYGAQGQYTEAQPLYQRSLAIYEEVLGGDHSELANTVINNLANLYRDQGRYIDAEALYQRSLAICAKVLGGDHPDLARTLNNLALLYSVQGRYAEAEPMYERSLVINEKALGGDHPDLAKILDNLANLYRVRGRYADAEQLLQRSLAICEKALGGDHPDLARTLNNLALAYCARERHAEAEPLIERSLAIYEKALGGDHPDLASALNNLALVYSEQGRHAEAEPLLQRSLAITEKALGGEHPGLGRALNNLAYLYGVRGYNEKAEPLYERSLAIIEGALGSDHPELANTLDNLANLYRDQGRYEESATLYERSLAIYRKALGNDHPDFAETLNNLMILYRDQGRDEEAEELMSRTEK